MEKLNFNACTLALMEEVFGLRAVKDLPTLTKWASVDLELKAKNTRSVSP